MNKESQLLKKEVYDYCQSIESEFDLIPSKRKEELVILRNYISKKFEEKKTPELIVICTHNSRRSHLGQLWLAVGVDYYHLPDMQTYSGGTEATAFNPRAVNAMRNIGFQIISKDEKAVNPIYEITWKEGMTPYQAFSKKYESEPNPTTDFAAIMVCTSADQGCPFVAGCDFRLSLPYEDPKAYDDTDLETIKYAERCRQIGREMLFVLSEIEGDIKS